MGPKKGKDITENENYWRTLIEDAQLDEDNWKVKVIMIEAAGSDQDRIYLNKFETFAAEERRFVIKNICKTETTFMINQLGAEKKVKDDNLRVFEEGQAYLKDKKDIPPDILALIIKHLILKMKVEYLFIKQQRLDVSEGMKRESVTMIHRAEVRGTVNDKPPIPPEPIEPSKGKGKKEDQEILQELPEQDENKKFNTLLRVRGEEWRDKVYIDDFPVDGPNLYVAVTSFLDPNLAGCLIKIGIPLRAVIQIRIDPTATTIPSSLFRATKRGQSQTEILTEKSLKFWEDLQQLRINEDTSDDYKNTAFVVFSPPYWDADNLTGCPDKIYDEVCFLMYDVQDLTRQHVHYLKNMDIINIPNDDKDLRYLNFYHSIIDDIPLEAVTTYLILDSILQTVCKSKYFDEESSRSSLSTAVTLNQTQITKDDDKVYKAENLVNDLIGELCKLESRKMKYRLTYGDEYENHKDPIVINYGDFCEYNTFHLGNINLDNIVRSMLFGMPINKLWGTKNKPSGEVEAKIDFHINVLLSCFERSDVENGELNRLIHILACRKLYNNRSSLKKNHLLPSTLSEFKKAFLKRSIMAEPLPKSSSVYLTVSATSYPSAIKSLEESNRVAFQDEDDETSRIKFLFDCPDISELVSAAEIANGKPINHMIDDFEYFEDFSGICGLQMILDAFNKFNCMDYKYCEVTDNFVMMFYNSHDRERISRNEWRCHISTPLCLQDFFDFVLEENYNWIRNEEHIYDERIMLRTQSECKDFKDPLAPKSCVENIEVEMELLMEGSLKYEELNAIDEPVIETSESKTLASKKNTASPMSTVDYDSKSSRKTKSPATTTPKFVGPGSEAETKETVPAKPFSGYNLGDRRVEVFGKDSMYFSKDGTRVSSSYSLLIPINLEYVILNVIPGNGNNEFWMHKALGELINADIVDICESFRINSKDQVIIYIKKQLFKVPLPVVNTTASNTRYKESSDKTPSAELNMVTEMFETRTFHSVSVTWPNGLITESVHEHNSPVISHVKQFYLTPMSKLDEEMRCVSLNGEVIIFKRNGQIDILRPDAVYIKIYKCEKRIVSDELPEDLQSVSSSDKSKKGKIKEKSKDKPSKTSSKSSKNALDEDVNMEPKPIEYGLFIDDFDIIESNGLRQKCISDKHFDVEKLLIKTATDFCLGEIFSRRMDGVHILLNKDGIQIVTFPNGTRIITYFIIEDEEIFPEWTDEEIEYLSMFDVDAGKFKSKGSISQKSYTYNSSVASSISGKYPTEEVRHEQERMDGYISVQISYSVEHESFTTVTINKSTGIISIESPNNTCVSVDAENNYEFFLDSITTATFNGENLDINYEACPECKSYTRSKVTIKSDDISSLTHIQKKWLTMKDSFCKKITVNEEGNINVIDEPCSDEQLHENGSIISEEFGVSEKTENILENSLTTHGKCGELYEAKSLRFFVLRRDLTCSELIHRKIIDQYKKACRWQPWCTINQYDTFGDHRSMWSILTPVHLNEAEKWLMDSKLSNKPKYLTYKDLKKDAGKGFYHWMRPYKRFEPKPIKPDNVLPERLPRAFVLRTLEQQWSEAERENLKGAKELLNAILRYRMTMETDSHNILDIPIRDTRSEDERKTDEVVQALAHRIYEDLRARLAENVQSRATASITTKPPPPPEDLSIHGELDEESRDELRVVEEERESAVKETECAEEMSPNLRRYWRRRAEELREEQFYQYLLREGSVPPYFRNVLGGAIWWDMNKATDDAAILAERKKMKCVCDENAAE